MKTLILAFATILFQVQLFAQAEFKIVEETRSMSRGSFNTLVVHLPGSTYKNVQKLWSKYVKELKGKVKYNRKTDEYFSDDASIRDMSENAVDITSKVIDKGDQGTELAVWINLGVTYLSSKDYPERFPAAEVILKKISLMVSADLIESQLITEEEKLKVLNSEFKTLEQEKKAEDDNIQKQKEIIKKAEESIKDSEGKIEKNLTNQEYKTTEIKEQEKVIEQIKKKLAAVKA